MDFKELYQKSKKGRLDTVVIEGAHAFKHAARFGAEFIDVIVHDQKSVEDFMRSFAAEDDVKNIKKYARVVARSEFDKIASDSLRTGIIAIAKKPQYSVEKLQRKQIIFIENPRDIDNVGAVVRVAAAYGAAAVCITGEISPWHMMAIRAGAGLQWAVPVLYVSSIEDIVHDRKTYACDAEGKKIKDLSLERDAVLIFGTERGGITEDLKLRADGIISIPMQKGVSSMNLATSVSAVLFGGIYH